MDNKTLQIPEKTLEELINFHGSKLVGKICKRFELSTDLQQIKKEVRELVYESFRDFRDILLTVDKTKEIFIFELKAQPKQD